MSESEDTFRIQARFNKVEYADLYEDLAQYTAGSARAGRIRRLMRLGLAAARGHFVSAPTAAATPAMHPPQHGSRGSESERPAAPVPAPASLELGTLESLGMDPTQFRFG